jgi:O-acetyl-ADP-ribose deacetylase (regulator of RNase III)
MPVTRQPLPWRREFSPEEMAVVARGLIPQEMEDKWFIFLEDDVLSFHRSWTGLCCYEVRIEGGRVSEAWFNPEVDYTVEQHADMLDFLVERLLLDRPIPFPRSLMEGDRSGAVLHHLVGYAESSAAREPLDPEKAGIELSRGKLESSGCEFLAYGCKANGDMKGGPSAPILLAAGPEVQESLRERLAKTSRALGEVVLTPPFGMGSAGVLGIFHVVAFAKDLQGGWISEPDPLAAGVRKTLQMCHELRAHSLALAALSVTKPNVGAEKAAGFMVGAAREYQRNHPEWPLRIVFCLPDHNVYQAFLRRLRG